MSYRADDKRYEQMKYNRTGQSGLKLPAISLGLWQNFGDEASFARSREMLLGAFDLGITHFDLANNYGPQAGSAEETLGKVIANELKPYRDELVISTKAGYYMWPGPYGDWGSKKYLVSSLDQSLLRMGLDYVDIFYHHREDPDTPLEETMDALAGIVRSGKALYIGLSNYSAESLRQAYHILDSMGERLLILQPRYSMIDQSNDAAIIAAGELGVGSIAYSPLAQGLLTNKYLHGIPEDSRAGGSSVFLSEKNITETVVAKARALNQIAEGRGQSLAQMALAWVLRQRDEAVSVTSVLIGASRLEQIRENSEILKHLDFTAEELEAIKQIVQS